MSDFLIVRNLSSHETGNPFDLAAPTMAGAGGFTPPEPSIDVVRNPAKREIVEASRDSDVVAIAPVMPTTLIRPLPYTDDSGAAAGADASWGIDAIGASASEMTGKGVTVAVLDTGIDADHAAFSGVTLIEKDFTGTGNGDLQGHGTHCAGTIFGRDTGGKRIGVARGVDVALIAKVLDNSGGGSSDAIFNGLQWAAMQGVNVLSMSLGFDFPGLVARLAAEGWPVEAATSAALEAYRSNLRAFDKLLGMIRARAAFGPGMLIVAAAGNESNRDGNPPYEIAPSLPAAAEGVLSVGALGRSDAGLTPAAFSNTYPQISGPGVGITSAQAGGGLIAFNGTSMACPHVAGAACLWWEAVQKDGFLPPTASSIADRLLVSARSDVIAEDVDPTDCGAGIVAAPQ